MKRMLKWVGIVVGGFFALMIVLGLIGAIFGGDVDEGLPSDRQTNETGREATATPTPAEPTATPTATPKPTATPTATPTPEPIVYEFEGTGNRVLGPVALVAGALALVASHGGQRNFVVELVSGSGNRELSINTIGTYAGARAHTVHADQLFGLAPGPHRVQVQADGSWSLKLQQEFPGAGKPPPIDQQGSGDDVVRWLLFREGQYVLTASHQGRRNFVVELVKSDGSNTSLLVNDIGTYSGQTLIQVQRGLFGLYPDPGLYALVVQADGSWTVVIE